MEQIHGEFVAASKSKVTSIIKQAYEQRKKDRQTILELEAKFVESSSLLALLVPKNRNSKLSQSVV